MLLLLPLRHHHDCKVHCLRRLRQRRAVPRPSHRARRLIRVTHAASQAPAMPAASSPDEDASLQRLCAALEARADPNLPRQKRIFGRQVGRLDVRHPRARLGSALCKLSSRPRCVVRLQMQMQIHE